MWCIYVDGDFVCLNISCSVFRIMADRLSVNLVHEVNFWAKTFVLPEFSELNNLCATAELESK